MVEEPDTKQVDGSERSADETDISDESLPVAVGDNREKHISLITRTGKYHEHGNVYLKHSSMAFFVSLDASFPDAETTRYPKNNLSRVEVTQHHSACFITTATAGDGPALDALRNFRDGSLSQSALGRALVTIYNTMSPPIAATLARHPSSRTTRLVRWLVHRCASLAQWRTHASPAIRVILTIVLVTLYIVGLECAAFGHLIIRYREN